MITKDIDKADDNITTYTSDWRDALPVLSEADEIIGHNIIDFDIPVIQKFEPDFKPKSASVLDTLVWARLVAPDIQRRDFDKKDLPPRLNGSHSLKAWGLRLGKLKGDFEGPWDTLTEEMLEYAVQDVHVTHALHDYLTSKKFSKKSISLEHAVHRICSAQERHGFLFDKDKAWNLATSLEEQREKLEKELQEIFPPYEVRTPFMPKATNSKYGYVKGEMTEKVTTVTFNPQSRHHIANRLKNKYRWKPKEHTPNGQPKIDETILQSLNYPEAKKLADYFLVAKRIAALSEGRQAWLSNVKGDNRIHGRVLVNGAVTGRATHRNPNMAQIPSCRVPFGKECRELFTVPEGKVLVGSDVSGLELRVLAHFMYPIDKGAYAKAILEGDIHTFNQQKAGLETRDQAKTFIYALIFSAGAEKLGQIVGGTRATGAKLKKRFFKELPALDSFITKVKQKAEDQGYLTGLDGRLLKVRSPHSSPNLIIQSAGALICKRWLIEINKEVHIQGLRDRCRQVAWVHDEVQWECDEDVGELFGELAVRSIKKAGDYFGIRTPLDAEYRVGRNWSETH